MPLATATRGTLLNGATFTTGRNGSAVNLDGVNDFVNLGAAPAGLARQVLGDRLVRLPRLEAAQVAGAGVGRRATVFTIMP